MNIKRPVDVENEIRLALTDYFETYCRPLPEHYSLPNLLISCTGGTTRHEVDTFTVVLDARAETDAAAFNLLSDALGVLEEQAKRQTGALRNVIINSLARWGSDPVRPDLKLCTATVLVTCHRETATISES